MKMMILLITVVVASNIAFAKVHKFSPEFQAIYDAATAPEVQEAQRKGAKAKIIYRVVDDEGMPITNATVCGQWQNDYPRKTWQETFVTDTNGVFVAKGKVGGRFGFYVKKEGYYLSSTGVDFHWREGVSPLVKDGKWQPYGENRTLAVKRNKHPVDAPTLLHTVIDVPATNVWLGLDMETFRWVKPYGDGAHSDMLLRFNSDPINKYEVNWATMDVSFTNNPYAGFYVLPKDGFSEMQSVYHADTNMAFRTGITYSIGRLPKDDNLLDDGHYMVFRTRTTVDEEGKLVSAHYGKIYGRWGIWGGTRARMIFFNTTPNDTNLEDMKTFKESELRKW